MTYEPETENEIETGSIREIHQRLKSKGHRIGQPCLRTWIKKGILPASYSGKKAYIKYSNVLYLLEHGTPAQVKADSAGGIRKIDR